MARITLTDARVRALRVRKTAYDIMREAEAMGLRPKGSNPCRGSVGTILPLAICQSPWLSRSPSRSAPPPLQPPDR